MEVGDVDMDGIDELAMTVNVNDLKEKSYDGSYRLREILSDGLRLQQQ